MPAPLPKLRHAIAPVSGTAQDVRYGRDPQELLVARQLLPQREEAEVEDVVGFIPIPRVAERIEKGLARPVGAHALVDVEGLLSELPEPEREGKRTGSR